MKFKSLTIQSAILAPLARFSALPLIASLVAVTFGAHAQVGFTEQPTGVVTCSCACSDQKITITARASRTYSSWQLWYIPDWMSSAYPASSTLVASGNGSNELDPDHQKVICEIPRNSYYSGAYQIYLLWSTIVPGGPDELDPGLDTLDGVSRSDPFTVTIYPPPPTPQVQPSSLTACLGSTVKLVSSVIYFGDPQSAPSGWKKNNSSITMGGRFSQTRTAEIGNGGSWIVTSTLTISNVTAADGLFAGGSASYSCHWTSLGCGGSVVSDSAVLVVAPPMEIYSQPSAPTQAFPTNVASLGGAAVGASEVLLYQWQQKIGGGSFVYLPGQTNSSIAYRQYRNDGTYPANGYQTRGIYYYRCVLTGQCTNFNSDTVAVTVGPPAIAEQPVSTNTCLGDVFTLSVSANNVGPEAYYTWYGPQIGNTLPAYPTDDGVLTITNAATNHLGEWFCIVSGGGGGVQSDTVLVTAGTAPVITSDPVGAQVPKTGGVAVFQVKATGSGLRYAWRNGNGTRVVTNGTYPGGMVVNGATTSKLTLSNITDADAFGNYRAWVSNSCGVVTSPNAQLTLTDCPIITQQPQNVIELEGKNASLSVAAIGTPPPAYQWLVQLTNGTYANLTDGPSVTGSQSNVLTLIGLTLTQGTNYLCVLTNTCGTVVTSSVASLTVFPVLVKPLLGPDAGTNSIVVPVSPGTVWTAWCDATWLHLSVTNGTGGQNLVYTYDGNFVYPSGNLPPRSCTLTVAGIPITVTQAGTLYEPASFSGQPDVTISDAMPFTPAGVAVDPTGNLYMADNNLNGGIWKRKAVNGDLDLAFDQATSTTTGPSAVAADWFGNVYTVDGGRAVNKWDANGISTRLFSSNGLAIKALAVDLPGNVYLTTSQGGANLLSKWSPATETLVTLTNLDDLPNGVAADLAGNVYMSYSMESGFGRIQIQKWEVATGVLTTLVGGNTLGIGANKQIPLAITVDGEGGVYFTTKYSSGTPGNLYYLDAPTRQLKFMAGFVTPSGVTVDASGNVFVIDSHSLIRSLNEVPNAFVERRTRTRNADSGIGSLAAVLPSTVDLTHSFLPTSDADWLTITGTSNGVVNYAYAANNSGALRTGHIVTLGVTNTIRQSPPTFDLGTSALWEGPAAGSDSVVVGSVPADGIGPWTARTNATWLHLSVTNGAGSTNLIFTFDANTNRAPRTGTLTIAGKTLTVTQAGSAYVEVSGPAITLVDSGLSAPDGVAVFDGDVYFSTGLSNSVAKWISANDSVVTLVDAGLSTPAGVGVDDSGNVYIADSGNNAIQEWDSASGNLSELVASGITNPQGVAVDPLGNVYFSNRDKDRINLWDAATRAVTILETNRANGIKLDAAGNLYIAAGNRDRIMKLVGATGDLVTLVNSGIDIPTDVAVDGSGNVFIAHRGSQSIKKWSAVTQTVTTVPSLGVSSANALAVDATGNLFVADDGNDTISELPRAFVDPTPVFVPASTGVGALPTVFPNSQNLSGPFTPTSDTPWLTITGVTNGIVSYSYTPNPESSPRTGYINVLGQPVAVTQYALPALSTTSLVVGPRAGSNTVIVVSPLSPWAANVTSGASWLHLPSGNQSGSNSTNLVFTFDGNPGGTRTGVITAGGGTVSVTQAGSGYVSAQPSATLVGSGLTNSRGIAVDAAGNVFLARANEVRKWSPGASASVPFVTIGLSQPGGVAVDALGNLVIANTGNLALTKWLSASNGPNALVTLVGSGLSGPSSVALDSFGNAYFTDGDTVKQWLATDNSVTTLVGSGLLNPRGIAVDAAGNVYISDSGNNLIKKWIADTGKLFIMTFSGLNDPRGIAVDVSGNVYVADSGNNVIKEWVAATRQVVTLPLAGLSNPQGVAVDGSGNVFIADSGNSALKELPYAYVDPTPIKLPARLGFGALPIVLPNTQNLITPYAPLSDQPWLVIGLVLNGQVNFACPFNLSATDRTGNLTVLGQTIPITQAGSPMISTLAKIDDHSFQLGFANLDTSSTYTILASTNVSLPITNWTVLGRATNMGGVFQYIDTNATNDARFYRIRGTP